MTASREQLLDDNSHFIAKLAGRKRKT